MELHVDEQFETKIKNSKSSDCSSTVKFHWYQVSFIQNEKSVPIVSTRFCLDKL